MDPGLIEMGLMGSHHPKEGVLCAQLSILTNAGEFLCVFYGVELFNSGDKFEGKKQVCHRKTQLGPVLPSVLSSLCPCCTGMRKERFQSGGKATALVFGSSYL